MEIYKLFLLKSMYILLSKLVQFSIKFCSILNFKGCKLKKNKLFDYLKIKTYIRSSIISSRFFKKSSIVSKTLFLFLICDKSPQSERRCEIK